MNDDARSEREKMEDRHVKAMFVYGACLGAVVGAGLTALLATLLSGAS